MSSLGLVMGFLTGLWIFLTHGPLCGFRPRLGSRSSPGSSESTHTQQALWSGFALNVARVPQAGRFDWREHVVWETELCSVTFAFS